MRAPSAAGLRHPDGAAACGSALGQCHRRGSSGSHAATAFAAGL